MITFIKLGLIKLFFLLVFCFILSCQGQEDSYEQKRKNDESLLYTNLIDSSRNSEELQILYKDYIYVPSHNEKMKAELSLELVLDYNQVESPGVMHGKPMYMELSYASGDGRFWFSGIQGEVKHTNSFTWDNGMIINHNGLVDENPRQGQSIFYKGQWYKYSTSDYRNVIYKFEHDGKEKLIVDGKKVLPDGLSQLIVIAVRNEMCILYNLISTDLVNKYPSQGTVLMYYNWEKQKIMDRIILPQTGDYELFWGKDTDTFNRVYFFWDFWSNEPEEPITKNLYTMIYDYEKDTLYYLYNKVDIEEPIIARHAILGEDENIYYQLVTDEAYYIYKVEVDWNGPMEETEYNPVFFEQHPDLKELLESYKLEQE